MWRQNGFPGNFDSDQSISDEEELNGDLGENCVSLTEKRGKEEGWQLQSRLEILRGTHELSFGRQNNNLAYEKQTTFFVEDEVEMPDFPDEDGFIFSKRKETTHNSDEEVISDDEDNHMLSKSSVTSGTRKFHKVINLQNLGSEKQEGKDTWSAVSKELIRSNENVLSSCPVYSKANNSFKGVKGKTKPKFSFHSHPHNGGLSQSFASKDESVMSSVIHGVPERSETTKCRTIESSNPKLLEDFCGENARQSEIVHAGVGAPGNGFSEHSMVQNLDGLQDKRILPRGNSKMYSRTKGKGLQLVVKRSISSLGDRFIANKAELMDGGSSSDDEANYQNLKLANQERKRQTMADQFQEALAATSLSNEGALLTGPNLSAIGLSKKLQQVIQSEKERDADFLNKLSMEADLINETCSILVKILSRYLDAKLTVCDCFLGKNIEESLLPRSCQTSVDKGRKRIVIFSPRVCSNVELDVGNLIRIHPPWKEVQVMDNDENIILCTYFSQISM